MSSESNVTMPHVINCILLILGPWLSRDIFYRYWLLVGVWYSLSLLWTVKESAVWGTTTVSVTKGPHYSYCSYSSIRVGKLLLLSMLVAIQALWKLYGLFCHPIRRCSISPFQQNHKQDQSFCRELLHHWRGQSTASKLGFPTISIRRSLWC